MLLSPQCLGCVHEIYVCFKSVVITTTRSLNVRIQSARILTSDVPNVDSLSADSTRHVLQVTGSERQPKFLRIRPVVGYELHAHRLVNLTTRSGTSQNV